MIIALIGGKFFQSLNIGVDLIGNKLLERIMKKVSVKLVKKNLKDFNGNGTIYSSTKEDYLSYLRFCIVSMFCFSFLMNFIILSI